MAIVGQYPGSVGVDQACAPETGADRAGDRRRVVSPRGGGQRPAGYNDHEGARARTGKRSLPSTFVSPWVAIMTEQVSGITV
jgi:hypothetical protein